MTKQRISQTELISNKILSDREFYWQKYVSLGQHKFADFLGVNRGSITHILKRCDFYKKGVKMERRESLDEGYYSNKILTPKESYLLGYILGDGCLRKNGNLLDVSISSSDIQILKSIKTEFPQFGTIIDLGRGCFSISCHCNKLVLRLMERGLTFSKSTVGCNIDMEGVNIYRFIHGLMDSDGFVEMSKLKNGIKRASGIVLVGHPSYIEQVKLILQDLRIISSIRYRVIEGRQTLALLRIKKNDIGILYKEFYTDNLFLHRKYERFHTYIQHIENRSS